jgi:signal transduction histidine kinase
MTVLTRRAPWSPRTWRQLLYLAGGIPAQFVALALVVGWVPKFWRNVGLSWWPVGWQKPWWPPLLVLVALFLALPLLTGMHRHRLRIAAGVEIPPQPAIPHRLTPKGIVAAARSQATWRQAAYHLLAGPALAVAAAAAVWLWLAGLVYALVYTYASVLRHSLLYRGIDTSASVRIGHLGGIPLDVFLTAAGVMALFAAPWVTAGVAALDATAARALLGPSRAEELEHRVEQLAQTRAGAVDAADEERRRLERDLHDGTQQRLVSLALNLGMARAETATVEEAHQAIAEAHEQAKAALTELRHLIRGLHPPVLQDRGLDAALTGVAARLPIPVRLTVDVQRRPSPTIEAVAYFVVSEGLTNITKHADASQAEVFVQRTGDRLHVIVSDDGVGGADPVRGTGLAGLAKRAASVDGIFEISSPPGGPTLLTVDLPCAR